MNIIEEFTGLTNKQAYEHAFNNRFLLRAANDDKIFLGNTQRADFLPYLKQLLQQLPLPAQIFDVGAGAGEIVDFALHDVPAATIHIEEPNEIILTHYLERLRHYPHLQLGRVYPMKIQDLYHNNDQAEKNLPPASQNLILAIHMIYYLTDFTATTIDPQKNLTDAICFLYRLLKPGGCIFLVYAYQDQSTTGEMTLAYFRQHHPRYAQALEKIYQARNQLLLEKEIATILLADNPEYPPEISSIKQSTYMYGKTLEDIAAMGLITELVPASNEPFALEKLHFCLDFVKQHGASIGLCREQREVAQKNMFRSNQPQVVCMIKKFNASNVRSVPDK